MEQNNNIPAMTPTCVHDYLREIGRGWTGQGCAVELGCWLGATAAPLLEGLVEAGYDKPFYCYDKWKTNMEEVGKAQKQGLKLKPFQDILPFFLENTRSVYPDIRPIKGRIQHNIEQYPGDPIEVCLFDAPKKEPVFSIAIKAVSPYWIPGVTVIGLLDYYFYKRKPLNEQEPYLAPVKLIENNSDCFELLKDWENENVCSCVFFKYIKKLGGV